MHTQCVQDRCLGTYVSTAEYSYISRQGRVVNKIKNVGAVVKLNMSVGLSPQLQCSALLLLHSSDSSSSGGRWVFLAPTPSSQEQCKLAVQPIEKLSQSQMMVVVVGQPAQAHPRPSLACGQ